MTTYQQVEAIAHEISNAWVAALENQWRERARSMCEQANGFERNEMYEAATGFRNRASVYFECAEELSRASAANEKGQRPCELEPKP